MTVSPLAFAIAETQARAGWVDPALTAPAGGESEAGCEEVCCGLNQPQPLGAGPAGPGNPADVGERVLIEVLLGVLGIHQPRRAGLSGGPRRCRHDGHAYPCTTVRAVFRAFLATPKALELQSNWSGEVA